MSVAGLEHMTTGSVAKRLILSRHTGRHLIAITNIALSHKVHACQLTAKSGQEICQKSEHKK